jgi:hypothetical protein
MAMCIICTLAQVGIAEHRLESLGARCASNDYGGVLPGRSLNRHISALRAVMRGQSAKPRYAHLAPEHKLSAVQRLCGTLENGTGTTTGTDTEAAVRASEQMVN